MLHLVWGGHRSSAITQNYIFSFWTSLASFHNGSRIRTRGRSARALPLYHGPKVSSCSYEKWLENSTWFRADQQWHPFKWVLPRSFVSNSPLNFRLVMVCFTRRSLVLSLLQQLVSETKVKSSEIIAFFELPKVMITSFMHMPQLSVSVWDRVVDY